MRIDGRKTDEMRVVRLTPGYVDYPEGSVLIEFGRTRVLCNATIENFVPGWRAGSGAGWVTAEYAMLPRSTHSRTRRETSGLRGRTQEISRLIGRSLRAVVDLTKLGERTIVLDCDVLQADGGTRTAAITGSYVALALALRKLEHASEVPEGVLSAQVAAVSLGVVEGLVLLDLCYEEDSAADSDFNIVMTSAGELVEIQGTAENGTFDRGILDKVLTLAYIGIGDLLAKQNELLTLD